MICYTFFSSPIGHLYIEETEGCLTRVCFDEPKITRNDCPKPFSVENPVSDTISHSVARTVIKTVSKTVAKTVSSPMIERRTDLLKRAVQELEEYFGGKRRLFDLPLAPSGTPFMQKVWNQLIQVPFGQTATYRDIAEQIGNPKAVRAVGGANHRNPIPIFIPCHRIIGTNGKLIGYAGGLGIKKYLLDLEQK
ncbi:MAG: methylated-DNA--[protein]-cysteine S-methyltransferase [Thermoguttaceae bacterium]